MLYDWSSASLSYDKEYGSHERCARISGQHNSKGVIVMIYDKEKGSPGREASRVGCEPYSLSYDNDAELQSYSTYLTSLR